jgi:hypothetical protein
MFANYYLKDSLEINWVILVSLHKRLALGLFNTYSQFKMVLKKYDSTCISMYTYLDKKEKYNFVFNKHDI